MKRIPLTQSLFQIVRLIKKIDLRTQIQNKKIFLELESNSKHPPITMIGNDFNEKKIHLD